MVFGLLLTLFGLGALCVLIYNCAAYALPFMIGAWIAFAVIHLGGGPIGGIAIGCFAGGIVFGLFQMVLGFTHSNAIRYVVVIVFVVPAVFVGYYGGLQLSALAVSSIIWQHIYAVIGAIAVGCLAFTRLLTPPNVDTQRA